MTDRIADQLTDTSVAFVTSRRAFELAIGRARQAGWTDDDITRITGLSRHQVAAVVQLRAA